MRRRENKRGSLTGSIKESLAGHLASAIIKAQRYITLKLSRWEKGKSIRQKRIFLILFAGICGAYCLLLLASAVFRDIQPKRINIEYNKGSPAIRLPWDSLVRRTK